MRVAGIAVAVIAKRPAVRLVVLEDSSGGGYQIVAAEDIPADGTDLASNLSVIAASVASRLQGQRVDRVFIRRADLSKVASNAEGPRTRLLAEGAAAGAARSVVVDTRIGPGKEVARWCNKQKSGLDAEAEQLVSGSPGVAAKFVEAAAAALSAQLA